jgi:hypothetical protein
MKKAVLIIGILVFLVLIGVYLFNTADYSDGSRAGTIIKLSEKGFLFKTYEGQLNLGMVILEDAAASGSTQNNIWNFSVEKNDSLVKRMEYCMKKGTRVLVRYNEKYTKLPWRGDTKYIVVGIEEYK